MRKFSDTDQPVSDADTAHADTDFSFRNTVSTYSTCFQAFSNHRISLSMYGKGIFRCLKKHFPHPKTPNYRPKKSNSTSKTPPSIIENFKKNNSFTQ